MTLVLIFNQYDIEPDPSFIGTARGGRGRVTWSIVRTASPGSKMHRAVFHVKRDIGVVHRGRVKLQIQREAGASTRKNRQTLTISRVSKASAARGWLRFSLGLTGKASPRKAVRS